MNARPLLIAFAATAVALWSTGDARPEDLRALAKMRRNSQPWFRVNRWSSPRTSARIPTTASSGGT